MKIISLSTDELMTVYSNHSFRSYLRHLAVGRSETPRAWLYEDISASEVLTNWLTQLETVKGEPNGELIYEFDTSQLTKWGPQGAVAPISDLMDIVVEGFKGKPKRPQLFDTDAWNQAKILAIKYLIRDTGLYRKLRPKISESVVSDMAMRGTLISNSGYPDFARRNKSEIRQKAIDDVRSGKWREYPAIALFRNYNLKTRLVWMYPLATNIFEGRFTQPLKEALMKSQFPYFAPWYGYNHVLQRISTLYEAGEFLAATDFTSTDAHFRNWQVLEVFDVIKEAFQTPYWNDLLESMLRVVRIPLIISESQKIVGDHGVSSGSNWTNDVESYFDYLWSVYLMVIGVVKEPGMAIGDDVLHRLAVYNPGLGAILEAQGYLIGQIVKAEKATNDIDSVKFLQRLTIRGYNSLRTYAAIGRQYPELRGIYPTIRALKSSIYPERFHRPEDWSQDMNAVRQFMILENCVDHPMFIEFVKFICDGNAYFRTFAKKTASEIDSIQKISRHLSGLNVTYNQEKRDTALSTFASIEIARYV